MPLNLIGNSPLLDINPILLFVLIVWVVIWKGFALWKAARKNSVIWFVVLLVVNTFGILEILYIYVFDNKSKKKPKKSKKKR
jgi:hypothetical protein